jgi:hypothetical protein
MMSMANPATPKLVAGWMRSEGMVVLAAIIRLYYEGMSSVNVEAGG